jgi:Histidine kinase-, DNA gyrase B-, and HSP90-like ATPase
MDNITNSIAISGLYRVLQGDQQLLAGILSLRSVAASLAETISRTVPAFTDHTVRHMDALWLVTDRILTSDEMARVSIGEAFVLACGFYLHDIGMAFASTQEGLNRVHSSPEYQGLIAQVQAERTSDSTVQARALAYAVRALHAGAAVELATSPIPGTERYLIESQSLREAWGETCGRVAESHAWTIDKIEQKLGMPGTVPLPGGRSGDLGYVASLLRLADYAHFGRDRARSIDSTLRVPIEPASLIHWRAQEQVDGPERDGADLVYRASVPISDVDAWWLHYEMLKGLDEEIRSVRRYLDRRSSSTGRLSLQGVRGITSPEEAALFVPTSGFLPIEINLRTGSIERLVQLLAGESLYGPEPMAAVRELIQNARDAVMLKAATASSEFDKTSLSIPIRIELRTSSSEPRLEVRDPGNGMTRKIMTDFLLSIASDYWATQFHADYPHVRDRDFQPAGRFGIGFLSVFMLGESVSVESNRAGGERCNLQLRGVGRRGEIRTSTAPSGSGTAVRVMLRESAVDLLKPLDRLVRAFAPMLPHEIVVDVDGVVTSIKPAWLMNLGAEHFISWTIEASGLLSRGQKERRLRRKIPYELYATLNPALSWYPLEKEKASPWVGPWPEYREEGVRLIASFNGFTVLSLKGIAVEEIHTPGFSGIIDLQHGTPDVSRREFIELDVSSVLSRARMGASSQITASLDALGQGLLVAQHEFLARCIGTYGRQVVLESSLRWISLLKLPGDVELISSSKLRGTLSTARSLFIAYGVGPWTAMKRWISAVPAASAEDIAIVVDNTTRDGPGYLTYGEEKVGPLAELWPGCSKSALFGTILRIAAEAWQENPERLAGEDGWRQKSNEAWGVFWRR